MLLTNEYRAASGSGTFLSDPGERIQKDLESHRLLPLLTSQPEPARRDTDPSTIPMIPFIVLETVSFIQIYKRLWFLADRHRRATDKTCAPVLKKCRRMGHHYAGVKDAWERGGRNMIAFILWQRPKDRCFGSKSKRAAGLPCYAESFLRLAGP